MTPTEIRERRNQIETLSDAARIAGVDRLRFDVLLAIAGGDDNPQELAAAALETRTSDFAWMES